MNAAAIGWEHGLTLTWRKPRKGEDGGGPTWSYARDFLPILQRTHGMWKLRNALRLMGTLTSPPERSPSEGST